MLEWAIVVDRLLQFGSALVLFGSPLFCLYAFKGGSADRSTRPWLWLQMTLVITIAGAFVGAVLWVLAETAIIFSDPGAFDMGAVFTMLTGTRFGRASFVRIGLIMLALIALAVIRPGRFASIVQAMIGAAVVVSFAWTGHGAAGEGAGGFVHLSGDLLHLLSAGVWIGALVSLTIVILGSLGTRTKDDALLTYNALESFSRIGTAVVAALVVSGIVNSWFLIGPDKLSGLFTTAYGQLLLLKLLLFAVMLVLAAVNRYRLSPRLSNTLSANDGRTSSLTALKQSLLAETALGLLVLLAVSWMGTLEPIASSQ